MKKMIKYIKKIIEILSFKELSILSSYLAYSLVLAIIPIITITILIIGFFNISIGTIINLINDLLPNHASDVIVGAISGDGFDITVAVLNIATFIGAGNGMYAIINASNSLYKIDSTSKIKDRVRAFLILIIMIVLLIFMIIVPMLGDMIINFICRFDIAESVMDMIFVIYTSIKWPVTFLLIFFAIKLIYVIAPSTKIKGEEVNIGALVTTILWSLFTFIFGYYISYFGKYDIIYGGLSSIIILLIWFYVISFILMLGIVINTIRYNK